MRVRREMHPHFLCNSLNYGKLTVRKFFNVMVFCYLRVRNKADKNMKKIVIIIIAILACINANAQWKTKFIEADEFLGIKAAAERSYYIDYENDGIITPPLLIDPF